MIGYDYDTHMTGLKNRPLYKHYQAKTYTDPFDDPKDVKKAVQRVKKEMSSWKIYYNGQKFKKKGTYGS